MALIDDIKAIAKDGADLTAIESGLSGLNPLDGLQDKESAWELIKSNKMLLSTFDQKQGERARTVEENLMNGKVQDIIKAREEEIRRELNPKESEAAKVAREFEEYKAQVAAKEAKTQLMDELSSKAKELSFDPIKARDYSVYGDKAVEKLKADSEWFNNAVNAKVDAIIKEKYGNSQPPKTPEVSLADIDERIREARANGKTAEALRLQRLKDKQ